MGRGAGGGRRTGGGGTGIPDSELHRFLGVPNEHLDLIKKFEIMDNWTSDGPRGTYNDNSQRLRLNAKTATDGTARHEVGHAVWHRVLTQDDRALWTLDYNSSMSRMGGSPEYREVRGLNYYISPYATHSATEAFAEAYMYATSGSTLGRSRLGFASDAQVEILKFALGRHYRAG